MAHSNSCSVHVTEQLTDSSEQWRKDALITLNHVAELKKEVVAKARAVSKARRANPKAKAIIQKQALRKAEREVRTAKEEFDSQIVEQAKRECLPLCEKMHEKLPQEIHDMILHNIIIEHNATFYHGGKDTPSVFSGTSPLDHCFDPEYTGKGLHKDIVAALGRLGSRFDFRGRHELLAKIFEQYRADFDLDLAPTIKNLGLVVTERDLRGRQAMLSHFENLFKLGSGTTIYMFIETCGGLQTQIARQFRRVLRVIFPVLVRLKDDGYLVKIIVNPAYLKSKVKNSSADTFSVVPAGRSRYEITPDTATFTVAGFEEKLKKCFEEYGDDWNLRTAPPNVEHEDWEYNQ